MKLEILLSTMNLKNLNENKKLIEKMNIQADTLTINQITNNKIEAFENKIEKNRVISKIGKGLSRSRNLAIENSIADICVLTDDDVTYIPEFEKIIEKEYEKNKNYDIICFFVESNNNERKVKRMFTSRIGKIRAMRICSFQITFKRKSIVDKNIKFDENYGAGTNYNRGEETIFLWECIEKGLKVKFINKKIADVNQTESSWFKGYDEEYFEKQGAIFYRLSHKMYFILILQFAVRKYKLYKKQLNFIQAVKYMIKGKKGEK